MSALAVLSWAAAVPASAAPRIAAVELHYERGTGADRCPDEATLRAEIAAHLGLDPFQATAERTIDVHVGRGVGEGLRAEVVLRNARGEPLGERVLRSAGEDCAELAASLVLDLSLAIDPFGAARASRPGRQVPDPTPAVPLKLAIGVGGLAVVGLAPSTAGGIRLAVELTRARLSLGLEGQADFPAGTQAGGGQISAAPLMLGLVPCAHFGWVGLCALLQAGAVSGGSTGLSNPQAVHTPYLAVGARAQADLPLWSSLALRPAVDLIAPLIQTTLTVGGVSAWTTSPVAGEVALSAVLTLP